MSQRLIEHARDLPAYAPPGHAGTVNVRLVDRAFCGTLEMIHGTLEPGGEAERHAHDSEHQIIYILDGEATVELGTAAPAVCGPGTVVRIPPRLSHRVVNSGDRPLRLIVLYSPPLPPRDDRPLKR